ncbi:diguanylate cyclase (GGDEF) domain-containing protein [Actinopolyspora alba]|uniref:Diguanylate cyclase (GGDEF) domain-containing protein n=1 Tax=Actinopolyspora alba TaxID=673379 RepID=A0A1I1ZEC4_9ACTN|nr:GGDEF domain-containing protein [Actinopolyspora alba]SFE30076.1 diguanylate cyclase (GGDEF) domain-containing protein [Actinopolyspora alba]
MLAELALAGTTLSTTTTGLWAHRLWRRLHTDPLTGLANRARMHRTFHRARWLRRRTGTPLGLLLLDVDQFKQVNDTHGHRTGDQVLTTIAAELHAATGPGELPVRLHGDELAVLLTRPDAGDVTETRAEQIRRTIRGPRAIAGHTIHLSLSVGAATTEDGSLSDLLALADQRMYATKPSRSPQGRSEPTHRKAVTS